MAVLRVSFFLILQLMGEPANEDDKARAALLFWKGRALCEQGEHALEGAEAFEASFSLIPDRSTLYARMLCLERAQLWTDAYVVTRQYFQTFGCDDERWRTQCEGARAAQDRIWAHISKTQSELTIDFENNDTVTHVYINDVLHGVNSFPLLVNNGPTVVRFVGRTPDLQREQELALKGGRVSMTAPRLVPPPVVVPPTDRTAIVRMQGRKTVFIVAAATTGASAAALATLGALTLRERERFNDAKCAEQCTDGTPYPRKLEQRFNRYKTATNTMIGVTAVLVVATAIAAGLAYGDNETTKRGAPPRKRGKKVAWIGNGIGF